MIRAIREIGAALRAAKDRRRRLLRRAAFTAAGIAALGAVALVPPAPRLVWNVSGSAPIGLYLVTPGGMITPGRMVLVEFRAEDPDVPIKPEHKMSKAQILKEIPANGFKLVEQFDGLPWQHVMFFEKPRQ